MATKVLMPQLGESVTEGTITKWLVNVGDVVNKYDPLAEVNTDKVTAEVPSTVSGRIKEIVVPEGETVSVGTLILHIDEGTENASESTDNVEAGLQESATSMPSPVSTGPVSTTSETKGQSERKQRYSPAVMRLAQDNNIDLSLVLGTGLEGRITRKDVQKVIDQGGLPQADNTNKLATTPKPATMAVSTQAPSIPVAQQSNSINIMTASTSSQVSVAAGDQSIPVTPVRKTIASRMVQSKHESPHAWMMVEVDATNLVHFRNSVKDEFKKKEGVSLTFLPFFIKAVVEALKEFPMLNSSWAGDQIIVRKNVNISIAVASEDALFVPVIKDADQKSVYGIAKSIEDLANRARAGKLTMDDMSGGTFTVNNTGSFGSVLSQPIINAPQAAIMSVESIVKRPVVINDMIAVRSMVNLCLSLDHRVLDGLVCGRFLQSVKEKLEAIGPETKVY
ncbi:dihydrolipoamide acetyltransferase family protein [Brevibacillus laterosporus]|uniref:Dihydrolipoamide acetyltransferase component of pyruvate dehydrogenase complex n=1 Tax=Brevibacillus laterosporus TaxID=1465 RepID=A0AAP3GE72_BRELA|nr:dihydrolipoamide acetyltransferase family protein [Brevibacillus laterosporus]MCR8982993.1 2-oxo acid dehydrogenase subunit E2 [Brevibacillus laterosporus]MCZ0810149.1 dihydrolipoamide acetyltransferase family protein [Brevibacillus laterosporus]MCZ0828775.1 dihydrolipoamide acetyltransferase family protein [Brevibacillus laterosporus]MCZ0852804.1 dihydrolipoamide acetyltransferase family protein [Brevibacillus laterosporus]